MYGSLCLSKLLGVFMTRLDRTTQDWQFEAYEMRGRHNSMVRRQRTIDEMNNQPTKWGVNMSEVRK